VTLTRRGLFALAASAAAARKLPAMVPVPQVSTGWVRWTIPTPVDVRPMLRWITPTRVDVFRYEGGRWNRVDA